MSRADLNDLLLGAAVILLALVFSFWILPGGITSVPGPAALSPRFWPRLIGIALILPGASIMISALIRARRSARGSLAQKERIPPEAVVRLAVVVVGMIAFAVLLPVLGIYVASVLIIMVVAFLMGSGRPVVTVTTAFVIPLLLSLFFNRVAGTALPRGFFEFLPF